MLQVLRNMLMIVLPTAILQFMLPWWIVILVAALVGFWANGSSAAAFASGFLAIGTLWCVYATFIDLQTGSILTTKIATLFNLPNGFLLLTLTSIIGGLMGGMGAMTGSLFRQLFAQN